MSQQGHQRRDRIDEVRKIALTISTINKDISLELLKSPQYRECVDRFMEKCKNYLEGSTKEEMGFILTAMWSYGVYGQAKFLRKQMISVDDKPFFIQFFQNTINLFGEVVQKYPELDYQCRMKMGDICRYVYDIDKDNKIYIERAKCYYEMLYKNNMENGHVLNMIGLVQIELKRPLHALQIFFRVHIKFSNYNNGIENAKQCRPSSDRTMENDFVKKVVLFLKRDMDVDSIQASQFIPPYVSQTDVEALFDFYLTTVLLTKISLFHDDKKRPSEAKDHKSIIFMIHTTNEFTQSVLNFLQKQTSNVTEKEKTLHILICCSMLDYFDLFFNLSAIPELKIPPLEKDTVNKLACQFCECANNIFNYKLDKIISIDPNKKMYFWNTRHHSLTQHLNIATAVSARFINQIYNNNNSIIIVDNNQFRVKKACLSIGGINGESISRAYFEHVEKVQFAQTMIPAYLVPTEDVFMHHLGFLKFMTNKNNVKICVDPNVVRALDAQKNHDRSARAALSWLDEKEKEIIHFDNIFVFPKDFPEVNSNNSPSLRSMVCNSERFLKKIGNPSGSEYVLAVLMAFRDSSGRISNNENMQDYSYENSIIRVENSGILISTILKFKHFIDLVNPGTIR
uniref:Separase n=1 Tax=Parastrongyloides trichosuri TaxID=131310 RepID=A0A0N4ZMH2_PARTI